MPRILSTPQLASLNNKAIRNGASRTLVPEFVGRLDDDGTHLVTRHLLVDDEGTIRLYLMLKLAGLAQPADGILDIDVRDFFALSEAEVPNDAA